MVLGQRKKSGVQLDLHLSSLTSDFILSTDLVSDNRRDRVWLETEISILVLIDNFSHWGAQLAAYGGTRTHDRRCMRAGIASGFAKVSGGTSSPGLERHGEDLCSYQSLLRISITQVAIARESMIGKCAIGRMAKPSNVNPHSLLQDLAATLQENPHPTGGDSARPAPARRPVP